MQHFNIFDIHGRVLGNIVLADEFILQVSKSHVKLGLMYSWREDKANKILSFTIIQEPAIEKVEIKPSCVICHTIESNNGWWQCCNLHTSEKDDTWVCTSCKEKLHPICKIRHHIEEFP